MSGIQQAPEPYDVPDIPSGLSVAYMPISRLKTWLEKTGAQIFVIIAFGRTPLPLLGCPVLLLDLPQLEGPPLCEVWFTDQAVRINHASELSWVMTNDLMVGFLNLLERPGVSLDTTVHSAYTHLLDHLRQTRYPHLWRIWNYFPRINEISGGLERYRRFCVGRHRAFSAALPDLADSLPAATAVGTGSGPLQLLFIAGACPAAGLGNPRQTHAYEYPRMYGPVSPSFSRASLCRTGDETHLLISGTASVIGHASTHIGFPEEQTKEIVRNLLCLLGHAGSVAPRRFGGMRSRGAYKVYVRHADHLPAIRKALGHSPLASNHFMFLQADLCREELLVEIEGSVTSF
ncbi:pteridine-dependent deoxygenase like protein [Nitrospira sp. KM1]|uniref:chorismate transformation enzyme, FkbO/Hyg5 family n=1 Tax=Nitrospira sp. KM1 TaxID=1936990 RepID=UPI0013A75059|nr:hypothetical protein [Nitrospira sp. KM1]BCA55071.1 pteridine-dependent deoxygenase like protein [Nitrospira sp. KM1]